MLCICFSEMLRQTAVRRVRPMTVTLAPLSFLNKKAQVVTEISETLEKKVERVFLEIDDLDKRLADLLDSSTVDKLRLLKGTITDVKDVMDMFHLNFKTKIRHALPQIRSGSEKEKLLVDMLDWRKQSPCNTSSLVAWIRDKKCDIDALNFLVTGRDVYEENSILQVTADCQFEYVVALVIKRYSKRDPYCKIIDDFNTNGALKSKGDMKFFSIEDKIEDFREINKSFSRFAEKNRGSGTTKFVVQEVSLAEGHEDEWEVFLRLFSNGTASAEKFVPPPSMYKIQVQRKHHFYFNSPRYIQ